MSDATRELRAAVNRWSTYAEDLRAKLTEANTELITLRDRGAASAEKIREQERQIERLSADLEDATARCGTLEAVVEAQRIELERWRATGSGSVPAEPKPDPIPPTPQPGEPWTHAWFGKSAAEKKLARPPGWVDPPKPRASSGYFDVQGANDVRLANVHFDLPDYVQKAVSNDARAYEAGVECLLSGLWLEDPHAGLKWLARLYNLEHTTVEGCYGRGRMGANGRPTPIEHLVYGTVSGSTFARGNYAERIGGKLWYIAHRPKPDKGYPAQNLPYTSPPEHVAIGNVAIDCEMDASRGSYSFTWFDGGSHEHMGTIVMASNVCVSEWSVERSQGMNDFSAPTDDPWRVRSCGAFTTSNYQILGRPHSLRRFDLIDNLIHHTKARHPVGNVRDAKHVVIRGNCIETTDHANPRIEINTHDSAEKGMTPPESVVIENNVSNGVLVRVQDRHGRVVEQPLHSLGRRFVYTSATGEFREE